MVVFLSTLIVLFPLLIAGCATTPPKDISNLCEIFYEKDDWYDAAADARDKWGVPIHVPMAMMYQESTPELTADRINAPLGIHPKMREKYAIRPENGKEAITFYEVFESFRGFSLLKLTPRTGRTHQIRVHLSYIKHPIVADDMYGGKFVYPCQLQDTEPAVEEPIINRCALHAWTLEFKHPATSEMVKFEAPLPEDMQNLLDMLRKYRKL